MSANKHRDLWFELTAFENFLLAFTKAARGRHSRASVAEFERELEVNLPTLRAELLEDRYRPGPYTSFYIHDPKRRLISAAPFRDRVVHHALVNIIEPIFERKFIFDTYANRTGKGTHRALDRCTYFLRRSKYVIPLDIRQFFPSIDHDVLLDIIYQAVKDPKVRRLCSLIVASGQGVLQDEYQMVYFPGDDLFALNRKRGLPIGNLTSQFWANVYLNPLDHFIKRDLKCRAYIRYVDDMLLFSDDKRQLNSWLTEIREFLYGLRLTLHENRAQPRPSHTGVTFLGFQVFLDHRRLKRSKAVHARRRLKAYAARYHAGEMELDKVHASVKAWINHAGCGDTWGLRHAILSKTGFVAPEGGRIDQQPITNLQ